MARRPAKGAPTIPRTSVPECLIQQLRSCALMLATGMMFHSLRLTASPVAEVSILTYWRLFRLLFYSIPASEGWKGSACRAALGYLVVTNESASWHGAPSTHATHDAYH